MPRERAADARTGRRACGSRSAARLAGLRRLREAALAPRTRANIDDPKLGSRCCTRRARPAGPRACTGLGAPPPPIGRGARPPLLGDYEAGQSVHLCTGPLYHAAPLAFSLGVPHMYGCGVVLMDGWDAEETLR